MLIDHLDCMSPSWKLPLCSIKSPSECGLAQWPLWPLSILTPWELFPPQWLAPLEHYQLPSLKCTPRSSIKKSIFCVPCVSTWILLTENTRSQELTAGQNVLPVTNMHFVYCSARTMTGSSAMGLWLPLYIGVWSSSRAELPFNWALRWKTFQINLYKYFIDIHLIFIP